MLFNSCWTIRLISVAEKEKEKEEKGFSTNFGWIIIKTAELIAYQIMSIKQGGEKELLSVNFYLNKNLTDTFFKICMEYL